jgi:hypothetical protein
MCFTMSARRQAVIAQLKLVHKTLWTSRYIVPGDSDQDHSSLYPIYGVYLLQAQYMFKIDQFVY